MRGPWSPKKGNKRRKKIMKKVNYEGRNNSTKTRKMVEYYGPENRKRSEDDTYKKINKNK